MSRRQIQLRNVRVNNLQGIDLDIPHGQWIAFCGLSGSGKSSLAFDTLYAEGQRRYIESLSPQTRQFLQQLDKPDADRIDGIPPAVAVRASRQTAGPRTTVGAATEIVEYLRLMFSKTGRVVCGDCQIPVEKDSPDSVANELAKLDAKSRIQVGFEINANSVNQLSLSEQLTEAKRNGFVRAIVAGNTIELAGNVEFANGASSGIVVVDRLKGDSPANRIRDSLETAFQFGDATAVVLLQSEQANKQIDIDGQKWSVQRFSRQLICGNCHRRFPDPEPRLFSSNSPLGACPTCEGYGNIQRIDTELVVPDTSLSIREGAIAPWNTPAYAHELQELLTLADDYNLPVDVPFDQLTKQHIQLIWNGVEERGFGGLTGFFAWLEKRKYKLHLRVYLSRWKKFENCPSCQGQRLNKDALCFRIDNRNLAELCNTKVEQLAGILEGSQLKARERDVAALVNKQVISRLNYLIAVGLGYMTLDRPLRTLSGGEAQRVSLTSSLSSTLVNMLYVLDEPSDGLHKHDIKKLNTAIQQLNDRGNTLVTVDHEESVICSADRVIEIGPSAGDSGGRIVFDGSVDEMLSSGDSLTGDYLSGRRGIPVSVEKRRAGRGRLKLVGATGNNLKNLTVEFPLAMMCVVTGVSGSGKSSLVQKTLYGAICNRKKKTHDPPLPYTDVFGDDQLEDVILVDKSPIGRSARSNPVTYVKAFDEIRKTFANTMEAKTRNLKPSHFSFNVEGGRCDKCKGEGQLAIDMQFLADITVKCEQCRGRRYRDDVLQVKYRGKNIYDVLKMTIRQAFSFFRGQPKVQGKMKSLIDVGLEYMPLGQSATTMSSGEAQRLKLASYLNFSQRKRSLFILDEPTTGLHINDVVRLLDCLDALLAIGHSMIIVEHNLQLIKHADWIIDLGPGAADQGGQIVAQGTPEQICQSNQSITAKYLKPILQNDQERQQ